MCSDVVHETQVLVLRRLEIQFKCLGLSLGYDSWGAKSWSHLGPFKPWFLETVYETMIFLRRVIFPPKNIFRFFGGTLAALRNLFYWL